MASRITFFQREVPTPLLVDNDFLLEKGGTLRKNVILEATEINPDILCSGQRCSCNKITKT